MAITLNRDNLLSALQCVIGAVERRNTLPLLAHVLLEVQDDLLAITATDLETELVGFAKLPQVQPTFKTTLPGRKLYDICKALPDAAAITFEQDEQQVALRAGRSRFTLMSLPVDDFPKIKNSIVNTECVIRQANLRFLIERTQFAMAQQDVRYFLNGLLFDFSGEKLTSVATDGHRLAVAYQPLAYPKQDPVKIIVPRKGIQELSQLLISPEGMVTVQVEANHVRFIADDFVVTSKLIDGRFPDYARVLPKGGNHIMVCDKALLKQILTRVSILSNEKCRGIRFELGDNTLVVSATNPEQEQAEEEILVNYTSKAMSLGFNVTYLIDILNVLQSDTIKMSIVNENTGVLVEDESNSNCLYVVMPMRI
jgi:DNA polymerase III subunit beta